MVKQKSNLSFSELVQEKYGNFYALSSADDTDLKALKFISTGSLSLDASLGRGGIPRGRVTFIYGREGSAKTHIVLDICKNALIDEGLNVLYIDAEAGVDQDLVQKFFEGIDCTLNGSVLDFKLILPNEKYMEVMKVKSFEQALNTYEIAIRSGEFKVVVLDSISASSPEMELEKELDQATVSIQAKKLPLFFRRNMFDIMKNEVAAIFIGQVRDKIGAYIPTEIPTGGHAILHFTTVEIQLRDAGGKDNYITQEGIADPIGVNTVFSIKKNKLAPPFRTYAIPILFGKGIDRLRDFVGFSEYMGVLQRRGSFYTFDGEIIGQGLVKTMNYLKENPEILDKIKRMVYNILGVNRQ